MHIVGTTAIYAFGSYTRDTMLAFTHRAVELQIDLSMDT